MLIQELAGGVVVLDRETGACHAVILGRLLDQRQCRLDTGAMKIADSDLDRIGRERAGGQRAQADDDADKQPDHDFSLNSSPTEPTMEGLPG